MQTFPVHTLKSAPEQSKPSLERLQGILGVIPNLAGTIATSPVLMSSFVGLVREGARRQLLGGADLSAKKLQAGQRT
jgi:hypothetical protein